MIPISAYTVQCPQCGYKKRVRPKSDVLPAVLNICPKCKVCMEKAEESALDKLLGRLFPRF